MAGGWVSRVMLAGAIVGALGGTAAAAN